MKKRETAWQSRAHRVWFGICTVCLSLYIAYVTYLSQSGFLTGGVQTAAALCAFAALSAALCRLLGGAGYFDGHLWLRICGLLARRRQL